jgi:hypothetical protein
VQGKATALLLDETALGKRTHLAGDRFTMGAYLSGKLEMGGCRLNGQLIDSIADIACQP